MVALIVKGFKVTLFSIFILVFSQIKVRGVRICDHTGNILEKASVRQFTKNISKLIDFKVESSKHNVMTTDERVSATNKKSQTRKNQTLERVTPNEKRDLKKILRSLDQQ